MSKQNPFFSAVTIPALVAGVLLLISPSGVFAQAQTEFHSAIEVFKNNANGWQMILMQMARWLFWTLAIMQFCWTNMVLALRGGDVSDFINTNVKQILTIGMMFMLLFHWYEWAGALIKGFWQAGMRATGITGGGVGSIDPAYVFGIGLDVASALLETMSWYDSVVIMISALVLVICFAFLAAFLAVAIVEYYIVVGGAVLFLGFGGSEWTSDIAKRTMMYAVSVGAKLFAMQLIIGVSMGSILAWTSNHSANDGTDIISLIGLILLIVIMARSIPDLVQGLLSGASVGGSGTMLAAAGAGAAAGMAMGRGGINAVKGAVGRSATTTAAEGAQTAAQLAATGGLAIATGGASLGAQAGTAAAGSAAGAGGAGGALAAINSAGSSAGAASGAAASGAGKAAATTGGRAAGGAASAPAAGNAGKAAGSTGSTATASASAGGGGSSTAPSSSAPESHVPGSMSGGASRSSGSSPSGQKGSATPSTKEGASQAHAGDAAKANQPPSQAPSGLRTGEDGPGAGQGAGGDSGIADAAIDAGVTDPGGPDAGIPSPKGLAGHGDASDDEDDQGKYLRSAGASAAEALGHMTDMASGYNPNSAMAAGAAPMLAPKSDDSSADTTDSGLQQSAPMQPESLSGVIRGAGEEAKPETVQRAHAALAAAQEKFGINPNAPESK